ncbi:hypothetical protein MBANPS3_007586 [Mucor bainieri]
MSIPIDSDVDEELFHFYLQFRLRQIEKSMLLWDDNSEKAALVNILSHCQHVNGNTLRMVFRDIFDKSAQPSSSSTHHVEPAPAVVTKPIVTSKPTVITAGEKRRYSTSEHELSTTTFNRRETTPLQDDTDYEDESDQDGEASVYSDSSSEGNRRGTRRKKHRVLNNDPSVPSAIKHLITNLACTDLDAMLKNLQVTKDIFRSRMNRIKDTFKIHYIPRNAPGFSGSTPKCRFEIFKHFNYKSPIGQCQLNMIAYQLGKIEEVEKATFSYKQVKANRLRYYQDLSVSLKEPKLAYPSHLQEFSRHCERAVYVVRHLGAYVLFMPEVLPPTTYKKIQTTSVPVLKAFLESRCAPFKDIAQFSDKAAVARFCDRDRLIVSDSTGDLDKFLKQGKTYYSRFIDFSL